MMAKRMISTHCGRRTVMGATNGERRGPVRGGMAVRNSMFLSFSLNKLVMNDVNKDGGDGSNNNNNIL